MDVRVKSAEAGEELVQRITAVAEEQGTYERSSVIAILNLPSPPSASFDTALPDDLADAVPGPAGHSPNAMTVLPTMTVELELFTPSVGEISSPSCPLCCLALAPEQKSHV